MVAARWHYFEACQLFRRQEYQAAYMKLNDTTPLLADKHGMNLHLRLLEIMLLYELQHLDLMETKILNMRQFIKRTQKEAGFSRTSTLLKVLMHWHRVHYDFAHTLREQADAFEALSQAAGTHQMTGRSLYELIPFEQWIRQK